MSDSAAAGRRHFNYKEGYNPNLTAEDYAADSLAADLEQKLVFDVSKDELKSLEGFLSSCPPSQVKREEVGYIAVLGPSFSQEKSDTIGLQKAWQELTESIQEESDIGFEDVIQLARDYNITRGKWMIHLKTGFQVDNAWEKISKATAEGDLELYAKVTPLESQEEQHVISVYNQNFTDEVEVFAAEQKLRDLGIKCKMGYKPDVYSCLGIYRRNKWQLRPSIYSSQFDIKTGRSIIERLF